MADTPVETQTEDTTTGLVPDGVNTFGKDYVQQLRNEAAAHRTAKNEAVAQTHAEAKEYLDAVIAQRDSAFAELEGKLGAAGVELTKLKTALDLKVPSDKVLQFAAILQGTDEDSIKESAKSAKELFGGFKQHDLPVDHSQGSGGGSPMPLNGDPVLTAIKAKLGIN
jgi:hypothetical protein